MEMEGSEWIISNRFKLLKVVTSSLFFVRVWNKMGKIYVVFMMERIAKSYEAKKTQTQAKLKSDHPQKSVSSSQKIRKKYHPHTENCWIFQSPVDFAIAKSI